MTFAAMATWQAVLLLLATAALAAVVFRLRVRPPRILLPSLLLWRRVLENSREATWWERVRRAVSLVVTIAIAVALSFALTRPSRAAPRTSAAHGRTFILLDSAQSMLARTRTGETRWTRAVAEARRLAASAPDEVTIATTSDGIIEGPTTDLALIDTALDMAAAGGDPTWWPGAAPADAVHFITDGGVARTIDRAVTVHSVFEPAANVAITGFDVRPSLGGATAGDAYVEIANYAADAQTVHLTITRGRATVVDRDLEMGAGETLRQIVPLARGGDAAVRARIRARADALDADNEAIAWIERARPLAVTVVGARTTWLARLFAGDPDVRATFVDPSSYVRTTQADVLVFDRWAPETAPDRPALSFAPPLPIASEELRPTWTAAGAHAVVFGVDPFTVTIDKARAYRSLPLDVIASSARGTPLVYAGEQAGRRTVVVSFSAAESNLSSAPAFPVLVGNALDWLARVSSAGARRPGAVAFDDGMQRLEDEHGRTVRLTRVNRLAVGVLRSPGLYFASGHGARVAVPVNAGDARISNVRRTSLTADQQGRTVQATGARYPWWTYGVLAAFALACVEWWTWQRRITV